MGIFERIEKKVEGAVSHAFARAFKGDVQPVEITARLQRELDAEAKLMSRDKRLVPNDFTVRLSQHDHDKLAPYASTLTAELAGELRRHAREMGYVFNGPIKIDFDAGLPAAHRALHRRLPGGRRDHRAVRPGQRHDDQPGPSGAGGQRHPPSADPAGPGDRPRLARPTCGSTTPASRGRTPRSGSAPPAQDLQIDIVDLGSTNGIIVNGQKVRQAVLQEGSRIEIGSTRMLIHAPAGR